jgi:hypothetical protein
MLNEDNKAHNFISSSDSESVINYGSGSTNQKVTVPVLQRCFLGDKVDSGIGLTMVNVLEST